MDALRNVYADKRVRECFEFGRYPQGANGEVKPITWRVLQREADHLLVIAEQGLEYKPFNTEDSVVTWSDCTLRCWLNDEFMNVAFTESERSCVLKTSIANNVEPNTDDYVFLLSVDEARSLFANDRVRRAEPTEYAVANCEADDEYEYDGRCWWWLRSRARSDQYRCSAACVADDGGVCYSLIANVDDGSLAIRPALRIALSTGSLSLEPTGTPTIAQSMVDSVPPLSPVFAEKQVGESFEFGQYPQGANGEIEPITWRVLQREADHLLVIADQALECKRYHEQGGAVTWADCNIRCWLNSAFMSEAFNEQERDCILKTCVINNAGPQTVDYFFLLSVDEAKSLFADDRVRRAKPTEYAVENGVKIENDGYCSCWLRSRGSSYDNAAIVNSGGSVSESDFCDDDYLVVRPALRIALPLESSSLGPTGIVNAGQKLY